MLYFSFNFFLNPLGMNNLISYGFLSISLMLANTTLMVLFLLSLEKLEKSILQNWIIMLFNNCIYNFFNRDQFRSLLMQEHPGFPCNPVLLFFLPVAAKFLVDAESFLWFLSDSFGCRVNPLDAEWIFWMLSHSFSCRVIPLDAKLVWMSSASFCGVFIYRVVYVWFPVWADFACI